MLAHHVPRSAGEVFKRGFRRLQQMVSSAEEVTLEERLVEDLRAAGVQKIEASDAAPKEEVPPPEKLVQPTGTKFW